MPKLILSLVLIGQAGFYYGLQRPEPVPCSKPLADFPAMVGGWRMVREPLMDQATKDVLRADAYLARDYTKSPEAAASLFVAFFRSQRAGQTPHSPKNCLPGSGWVWTVADTISISTPGRAPIEVNRYLVARGDEKALVLYWYQSRNRVVASEYHAAAFTAWDALRYNRTDTALVRVAVPATNGESRATSTAVDFIQASFGTLREYFPN